MNGEPRRLMYHGTDQNVLNMTKDERRRAAYVCSEISRMSYAVLKENNVSYATNTKEQAASKNRLKNDWLIVCNAMIKYEGRINDNALFQYEDLYVTNSIESARRYAENSYIFGEQGSVAYNLYRGASYFSDYNSGLLNEEEDIISEFLSMTNRERHPVIVLFEDLPVEDIRFENGNPIKGIDFYSDNLIGSFRLNNADQYNLPDMKIIELSDY